MKKFMIVLTEKEYYALSSIIENGWANGDYARFGGEKLQVQKKAIKKFTHAKLIEE